MNLYKYKNVAADGKTVPLEFEYKTPFVWTDNAPDQDYVLVEGAELQAKIIEIEKVNYIERKKLGSDYAILMDARLIALGKSIPDPVLSETVRAEVDALFNAARFQVSLGRWISAKREISKVIPRPELQLLIDTYGLPLDQDVLIQEQVDYINNQVDILYN